MSDIIFVGACSFLGGIIFTLAGLAYMFRREIHFKSCECMECKMCEGSNGK